MTKMTLTILMVGLTVFLMKSKNPVKTSALLLLISSLGFLILKVNTGSTWFPLLMYLLFTGGVLMVFMILSSILPNEKTMKTKMPKMWVMVVILSAASIQLALTMEKENMGELKSMITSIYVFLAMSMLILCYFFFSMETQEKNQTPMRATF